jgi:uncharacterized protein YdeI (YjbR/CyaY-like superfamily)
MVKAKRDLPVIAFKSQLAWDAWLASQPARSKGLWLKLAKKSSGIASVSKQEAVDTALCHGWIDGQLDSFDDRYWLIRFTPRQSTSKWSEKNRARALQLVELKQMRAAGLSEIERAKKDGRWNAAYAPQSTAQVPDDLCAALAKNKEAKASSKPLIAPIATQSFTGSTMPKSPKPGWLASRNMSRCWPRDKPSIRRNPSP